MSPRWQARRERASEAKKNPGIGQLARRAIAPRAVTVVVGTRNLYCRFPLAEVFSTDTTPKTGALDYGADLGRL